MAITVRKVEDKADFNAFFEFPWKLYKGHPHWVPELPSLRHETLDRGKHAAWEYMTGDYFVAWRGQEPVGTIAAFVNHRHNQIHNENIGFFGFFECIDDQAAADALFKTAEDYLRGLGVTAMRGPANFTSNEMYGLLVKNFELDPMILMPYNPEYYIRLIENAGYSKAMELLSWRGGKQEAREILYEADGVTPSRVLRAIQRNNERREITVRTINMKNKWQEFELLRSIYHDGWEKNWGFLPMTERELNELVKSLGILLMPRYTFFGYVKGEPAGMLLLIPNFNEIIKHVNPRPGVPEPWWLLKTLYHWKIRPKARTLRAILMGVRQDYRNLGVDAAMMLSFVQTLWQDDQFDWAEAGWVLENNIDTNRLLAHFGAIDHRDHRLYQKSL